MDTVQEYLTRYDNLKKDKQIWNLHYQALAELFLTRKQDFTYTITPGEFLNDEIFDNTGQFAAYLMASVFLSMLWPDSSRTFRIKPVRKLEGQTGVEEYFRFVTEEMHAAMDNPKAGLTLALMEHFLDQGVFGTSGIGVFKGEGKNPLPVVYDAWSIKTMVISQNAQGFVDTIYIMRSRTVKQLIEMYGDSPDSVSPKVRELQANNKLDQKFDVLQVIEPQVGDDTKKGRESWSCRTVHIDVTNKHLMREGGYEEMPVFVARMFKTVDEAYGRSAGMMALPDAASLNALSEAVIVAVEKQLDPPLGVLDDGRLGGGVIDTSASALNVFNSSGRLNGQNPIFPLFTVGELQSAEKLKEQLKQSIMQAFFLDRLLDLNNQTQMTAYETSVRNRMRGESLGSIFSRQITEVLTPMIERTFNILYRGGKLGLEEGAEEKEERKGWDAVLDKDTQIIPEVILKASEAGLDIFEVEYISPAKRFMQSEKLNGIQMATESITALAEILPDIIDNINPDATARQIYRLSGAPSDCQNTLDQVEAVREARNTAAAEAEKIENAKGMSEVARNAAQAETTGGNP